MAIKLSKSLLDFSFVFRILEIIWDCTRMLTILRFALIILQAILPLVPLYLMKLLLDAFVGEQAPEFDYIVQILVGFGLVQVFIIIVTNLATYIGQLQSDIVSDHMSKIVISKAINTDLEYFDDDQFHDIFARAISQSSIRPLMALTSITQLVQSIISLIAIFILLLTLHWGISIVLVVIALPIAFIRLYFTNKLVSLKVKHTQQERRATYLRQILTSAEEAKEVRIFGFGEKIMNRFLTIRANLREEKRLLDLNKTKSLVFAQSVEAIAIIVALGFIASRALKGLISVGDIAMYFGAFQKGQTNINTALRSLVQLHENKKYLEHLFNFLDLENKLLQPLEPIVTPQEIGKISFENVSFTYPKTNKLILDDISFSAKKGELIAIVGQNGSGKSTIVKLLNRFYDVDDGSITINEKNIKLYDHNSLRKKITVLFQSFAKYNATVTDNIQFADLDKPLDQGRIQYSSRKGLAESLIMKLKNGYETQLGRSFRQGEELSGGEWQKLALSRAFYKDAKVIILDEPTSFIDPLAEDEIFKNIRQMAKDKILILITHRMYNLKQADRIIVLNDGKISESGSHAELMTKAGLYKSMFDKQE